MDQHKAIKKYEKKNLPQIIFERALLASVPAIDRIVLKYPYCNTAAGVMILPAKKLVLKVFVKN